MFFHVSSFNMTEHTLLRRWTANISVTFDQFSAPWAMDAHKLFWILCCLLFGLRATFGWETKDNVLGGNWHPGYSRESLLNLRSLQTDLMNNIWNILAELLSQTPNNKQGTHIGGDEPGNRVGKLVLELIWKKKSWSLPSVILSNVRSLRNKIDELQSNVNYMRKCRYASILHGVQWNMAWQSHRWSCTPYWRLWHLIKTR